MSTHYLFLLETPQANLTYAIQWLNIIYTPYYNKRHRGSGHLFQGRFGAILMDADEYLKEPSRYIHLNPIRAKILAKADHYPWSSYPAFVVKVRAVDSLETRWVLGWFGRTKQDAIKGYRDFVEAVDIQGLEDPKKYAVEEFILGRTGFVNWVKDTFLSTR